MSKNTLIGVVVVILILGVGLYLHSMGGSSGSSMYGNNPSSPANNTGVANPTTMPSMIPNASPNSTSASVGSTQTSAKNSVQIANFSFSPTSLSIKVGDSVTWTNQDSVGHSATSDDGSFDTGILAQGKSGSITFSKAGTYTYHCSVHPMMHGTITVQ